MVHRELKTALNTSLPKAGFIQIFNWLLGRLKRYRVAGLSMDPTLADGQSESLNGQAIASTDSFIKNSSVRGTDGPALAYMEARIMLETQNQERDATIKALEAAIADAQQRMEKLEKVQELQERAYGDDNKLDPGPDAKAAQNELSQMGYSDGRKDPAADANGDGKVTSSEQVEFDKANVVAQLDATKELLKDLRKALENLEKGRGASDASGQQASDSMVDMVIAVMQGVQQSMIEKSQTGGAGAGEQSSGSGQ